MTSLRRFSAHDLFAFNNVNLDYFTETYHLPFYLQYLARWPEYCLVGTAPRDIVQGYILGKVEGTGAQWHGHVTAVTVAPNFRRQGLAEQLMKTLEDTTINMHNAFFVDLFVRASNAVAQVMYERFGYSVYRRVLGYYNGPDSEDALGKLSVADIAALRAAHGDDIVSVEANAKLATAQLSVGDEPAVQPGYAPLQLATRTPPWKQESPGWGLQRINHRSLESMPGATADYSFASLGSGVNAYVVDTGIRFTHEEFGAFPKGGGTSRALPGMSVFGDGDSSDCNGHGTHNAAILGGLSFGVAKNVTLWSVRAIDCDGTTTTLALLQGLEWVATNHQRPAVVNLSLRSTTGSSALTDAATSLVSTYHIPVVVAAGNEGADACSSSPANATGVVTVGACTAEDDAWRFSNWGPCVQLYAPGVEILGADYTSNTAVAVKSGTSMACPMAAGAIAQLLEDQPDLSPELAQAALQHGATTGALNLTYVPSDDVAVTENLLLFNGMGSEELEW